MNSRSHLLYLEDNVADVELLQDALQAEDLACDITRVDTEYGFLAALEQDGFDLILADYTLPSFDGLSALKMARQHRPDLPFIFVSGTMGEEAAIEALKTGATDYVLKTRLSRLAPAVRRALREARERWQLCSAERELREREAEIRRLVEASIVGIFIWNPEGQILEANDAFLRLMGYSREELLSGEMCWTDLTPPEWPDHKERLWIPKLKMTGSLQPFEQEYLRKDGSRVPVLIGAASFDESVNRGVAFVLDLTERKRAEEAARRSERELRDVIETIPAVAWSAHADGSNAFVNSRWTEFTGLSAEQTAGPGWHAAIHPDDVQRHIHIWRMCIATGEPLEIEVRMRRADGQYRWHLCRGVPLRDERRSIVKWYGVLTDIEDRKRAEQEREQLRQLEAGLAHMNRVSMMGEMAASLAHEIKQPIAAAINSANSCITWLGHEPPNLEKARAAAAKVDEYGNRAAEIIDRIRSFYKYSPPQRELVEVNRIIHEILMLLDGEATRSSVTMRTKLAAGQPVVLADRVQLQQVFMNLMLNAIEAMKDAGGELTVKSRREQDGQLLFSVSDTGPGLPSGNVDQIFSAFFTTKTKGSGLGLAISRSVVESHGGRLWATANDGRGATFHFSLPTQVTESTLTT
jgi:PAS domain S-box-containing protein